MVVVAKFNIWSLFQQNKNKRRAQNNFVPLGRNSQQQISVKKKMQ